MNVVQTRAAGVNMLHGAGSAMRTCYALVRHAQRWAPHAMDWTGEKTMSIESQLQDLLKEAMRNKDARTADCVRMIKTKHMERRTASGFKGELDDALWLDVITAYQKQLRKAREEYAGLGARGAESLPQLDFEIELCGRFLPKMAGEDEVRAAAKEAITRMAVTDVKQAGKVMGDIMKTNKGKFDPAMVKRIVEQELTHD
jgi:uncharacterized protein YqeY